jgi:hypothetical protein
MVPEKGHSAYVGTRVRQTISVWSVGGEPKKMGEKSYAWVVGMRSQSRGQDSKEKRRAVRKETAELVSS